MSSDRSHGHQAEAAREPAMPEVLAAVDNAMHRRTRPMANRRRRRFLRGTGLGVALALASGTALAATGHWDPFWDGPHDPDSFILTPPSALQSASLGVLRRTQDNRDRDELLSAFLRRTSRHGQIRLQSIRYLRTLSPSMYVDTDGRLVGEGRRQIYVLIARDIPEFATPKDPEEARAARSQSHARPGSDEDAGRNLLCTSTIEDNWPAGASAPTTRLSPPGEPLPPRPSALEDRVTGGESCATIQSIRIKGLMSASFSTGVIYGLVPDGVASVRATTVTGRTIATKVENNAFELLNPERDRAPKLTAIGLPAPSSRAGRFRHGSVEWVDADGRVIRHVAQ